MADEKPELTYHEMPKPTGCDHEWPSDQPKDEDRCVKCGTAFLSYVFMECP